VNVGAISGDGASARIGATGAVAGISYSTIGSTAANGGLPQTIGGVGQLVTNSGAVSNFSALTGTGLTGAGSSAGISALGAGASFSASSIGDVSNAPLSSPTAGLGFSVTQQVTNAGTGIGAGTTNNGQIGLGTGALANGASASISATGAQAAVSASAINTTTFTSPFFGTISQTVTNGALGAAMPVLNSFSGLTTGDLSGHASSVSATATGAVASIGVSFINTTAWSNFPLGPVNQIAINNGAITNTMNNSASISVGSISGTGASVRASATGAAASIAVTSILSGPPGVNIFGTAGAIQSATNTGAVFNSASIVSTGTVSGMGSSASINATGAATSFSVASIADTVVMPPPTATVVNINQTSMNSIASPVTNIGSITLGGGNLGAAAAVSIGAVGASASVSFLAVK
jgi:hypothetical protein